MVMKPDGRDVHAYGGLLLVAGGLALTPYWPLALILPGAFLVYLATWRMR